MSKKAGLPQGCFLTTFCRHVSGPRLAWLVELLFVFVRMRGFRLGVLFWWPRPLHRPPRIQLVCSRHPRTSLKKATDLSQSELSQIVERRQI